jgi:hypothetical protein
MMVDLGTHEETYEGETRDRRTVRLGFELPTELKVFKEENGEQPYLIGRDFTFSMHKKSALRAFLQVWRGVPFNDEEASNFDIAKLLGVPAMVSISHTTKDDKTYAKLDSAMRLPKGTTCPPQVGPSMILHLDDFGSAEFSDTMAKLPEWVRKKIENSREYQSYYADPGETNAGAGAKKFVPATEESEDIPF